MRPYEPPGGYPETPFTEIITVLSPYIHNLERTLDGLRNLESSRMLAVTITQLETALLWLKAADTDERHKAVVPHTEFKNPYR